jgi:hypothetical protein
MRRRALLTTLAGGLAALTGCLGDTGPGSDDGTPGGTDDSTPTDSPTPTGSPAETTPVDGTPDSTPTDSPVHQTPGISADVTVESLHLQYGVVMPDSPDSIGVEHVDTLYVVAAVDVDGELPPDDFALEAGDQSFEPTQIDRLYRTSWGDESYYEGSGAGLLLFELSTGLSDPKLTWPGGEQSVGESASARLDAGPPQFSASFDMPETHEGTEAPPVDIEVTNEGDTEARFLGALNRVGPLVAFTPVARVSELVDAGATTTLTVEDSWSGDVGEERVGDGDTDVTYHLHYGEKSTSAEIRLVESGGNETATGASQ